MKNYVVFRLLSIKTSLADVRRECRTLHSLGEFTWTSPLIVFMVQRLPDSILLLLTELLVMLGALGFLPVWILVPLAVFVSTLIIAFLITMGKCMRTDFVLSVLEEEKELCK